MKTRIQAFTLIELMIVIAIIGILAAIAYPAYTDSVRKGRRSEGLVALQGLQLAQEKYRANNPDYADTLLEANVTSPTEGGYYTLAIANASPTGYTATAEAIGDQANDKEGAVSCKFLAVNQDGPNDHVATTGDQVLCWRRN